MPTPDDSDLARLRELLVAYRTVLDRAVSVVGEDFDLQPTARIKNRGTVLEKLQRQGGSWLKSIYDVAGMRIVLPFGRRDQDALVERLVARFADGHHPPKVIDRRITPSHGYRAVHVIIFVDGVPVEVQVRTRWQHEWAEVFEKLADKVGRGIRYGEPPENKLPVRMSNASHAVREEYLEAQLRLHTSTVRIAMVVSDAIDMYETADQSDPHRPALQTFIESELAELRRDLDDL
jgi:ppGpp synthetase/RelA/SpoT-type nucleotidyltranferase